MLSKTGQMCIAVSPITLSDPGNKGEKGMLNEFSLAVSKDSPNFHIMGKHFEILNVNAVLCSLAPHKNVLDPQRVC